jgi:hypothetical protein
VFGILYVPCLDADLSSDIRTRPIWSNTISQLELITDHKELTDRLTVIQNMNSQERLGSAADGSSIVSSRKFVAPTFTVEKKSHCGIKFVKCLVRKNHPEGFVNVKELFMIRNCCMVDGSPVS